MSTSRALVSPPGAQASISRGPFPILTVGAGEATTSHRTKAGRGSGRRCCSLLGVVTGSFLRAAAGPLFLTQPKRHPGVLKEGLPLRALVLLFGCRLCVGVVFVFLTLLSFYELARRGGRFCWLPPRLQALDLFVKAASALLACVFVAFHRR